MIEYQLVIWDTADLKSAPAVMLGAGSSPACGTIFLRGIDYDSSFLCTNLCASSK